MRAYLTLILLLVVSASALAGGYYFQKPDWAEPTGDGRVLIYDPATNADKNVSWQQLRGGFADMSTAARFSRYTSAGRVLPTAPELFDARPPLAHSQAAATITGLATVATTGSWSDILARPEIPIACVDVIQGFRGYSGLPGRDGTAATIAVGTVSTGVAGSNAIINNVGSSLAAVLDFTIPRGLDGTIDSITQAQLEAKLLEAGGKLKKRALVADTETLFEAARVAGPTSFYVTAAGLIVVADPVGMRLFSFDATTKQFQLKRSSGAVIFSISSTGRVISPGGITL